MPILYHHPLSAGCRYVRLILAEYGEAVTLVEEMPWERREDFLALNPAGTVPVFVDDAETIVRGASVIAEYLHETRGARAGEEPFMPTTPPSAPRSAGSSTGSWPRWRAKSPPIW